MSEEQEVKAELYEGLLEDTSEVERYHREGVEGISETLEDPRTGEQVEFPGRYQVEEAKFISDMNRALIADEMGVGKTVSPVVTHYMDDDIDQSLIVAPGYLREQWQERIQEYTEDDPDITVIDSYSEGEFDDLIEEVSESDFSIVSYSAFSSRHADRISEELEDIDFDMSVLDEVHNIKNPDAMSSQNLTGLVEDHEYLALLSGTPIPNDLQDTYQLIHLLEPKAYESAEEVKQRHRNQPRTIRSVMNRRRIKWTADEVLDLPETLDHTDGPNFELEGEHREVYDDILQNDLLDGSQKLLALRKAVLDPNLVDSDILYDDELAEKVENGDIDSSKYERADDVLDFVTDNDEKIVFFTQLRDGVTDKLMDRWDEYDAVKIDGTVPYEERPDVIEEFEHGESDVLVATTDTTGEGVSITEASNIAFLMDPWTPAERQQAIKRLDRRGQTENVDVINLMAEDTIDVAINDLLDQKREAIEFVEEGKELTDEQLEVLMSRQSKPVKNAMYTPQQKASKYFSQLMGREVEDVNQQLRKSDAEVAKDLADNHSTDWGENYSANTARAASTVLEQLKGGRVADIGSSFGTISEVSDIDTVNLDINPYNFQQERSDETGNVEGSMHQLPFQDEAFPALTSSLSFYYASPEGEYSEREQTVKEMNRVLQDGGKAVFTVPATMMDEENDQRFREGLKKQGFQPIPELTGLVSSEDQDIDFNVYMATAEKTGEPQGETGDWFNLEENVEDGENYGMRNRGMAEDFNLETLEGEQRDLRETAEEVL